MIDNIVLRKIFKNWGVKVGGKVGGIKKYSKNVENATKTR